MTSTISGKQNKKNSLEEDFRKYRFESEIKDKIRTTYIQRLFFSNGLKPKCKKNPSIKSEQRN